LLKAVSQIQVFGSEFCSLWKIADPSY